MSKRIFIFAGPNGAGKTTTAISLLPDLVKIHDFINADEIARGLAPLNPESMSLTASKLLIKRLRELLVTKKSFAFETTGAGTNYLKYLREAKREGYEINLIFLWLPNAEMAVKRVATRVSQGGHHIPKETIKRRYEAGLKNLVKHYLPLADSVLIVDNSTVESRRVIARKNPEESLEVEDQEIWETIQGLAHV